MCINLRYYKTITNHSRLSNLYEFIIVCTRYINIIYGHLFLDTVQCKLIVTHDLIPGSCKSIIAINGKIK